MESRAIGHEYIKQYLLGTIAESDREQLEVRLLADANLQEELSVAENEIVHDYLAGALSEQEKDRFDNYFLCTPERLQKLRFFGTLIKSIDSLPKPLSDAHLPRPWRRFLPAFLHWENPFLRLSFATAILLLVFGIGWVLVQTWTARSIGEGSSQLAVHTVTMSSGQLRDIDASQTTRVSIPTSAEMVEFRLPLTSGDYGSFRAILTTNQGEEKFATDELEVGTAANTGMLSLRIPSSTLTPGDYQLKLNGLVSGGDVEEIDVYYFRVIR